MLLPVQSLLGQAMNAPGMRNVNGIQLLNLVRQHGPVSRASLAKMSGLSKPTVSEQMGRLLAYGAVIETGPGEAGESGGKRPTLVKFNADAGRVVGVAIGAIQTEVAVANFQGTISHQTQVLTAPEQGPRALCDRIERAIAASISRSRIRPRAIGIGVPGRVDCRSGVVLESGSVFQWRNVDLRTRFEKRFGCPVRVDNDVNVALVAELHNGAARKVNTALLIRAETGVGSAVAIGRQVHHGTNWAAGEIGHLAAGTPDSKRVSPRGQLESVLGADQIVVRVRSASRRSAVLRRLLKRYPALPALFAAAGERDRVAQEITAGISHHAALAVANQSLAYDPEVVLLSGEIFLHILSEIKKFLSRTVPWCPQVQIAAFGDQGVLIGAVSIGLIAAYEQITRDLSGDAVPARSMAAGA